jgi:hypothetical protein
VLVRARHEGAGGSVLTAAFQEGEKLVRAGEESGMEVAGQPRHDVAAAGPQRIPDEAAAPMKSNGRYRACTAATARKPLQKARRKAIV